MTTDKPRRGVVDGLGRLPAFVAVLGDDPPARITVGGTALALGATVELDCIAYRPGGWAAASGGPA